MILTRRSFNGFAAATCAGQYGKSASPSDPKSVAGLIGLTTGSFTRHLAVEQQSDKLVLLDLPGIMRDDLDLQVLDLMTANLPSMQPAYLAKLRERSEQAGCVITNLKMNQPGIDMGSTDPSEREKAIKVYKLSIDAAKILGCRWVRPLPTVQPPDLSAYVDSYRQLIDYAGPHGLTLLIENFGWIMDDTNAIPQVIEKVGAGLQASVDTGNWSDRARYEGLAKAFPLAATCDFKVFDLGEHDEHPRYDLRRCFQLGWDAGFRGPWCFEHFHQSLPQLLKEMARLRDLIREWTKANSN